MPVTIVERFMNAVPGSVGGTPDPLERHIPLKESGHC
jgi:hypothetical protein